MSIYNHRHAQNDYQQHPNQAKAFVRSIRAQQLSHIQRNRIEIVSECSRNNFNIDCF